MAEWWVEEGFGGDEDAALEWAKAFKDEHGYLPDEDPDLLRKGMSGGQAIAEHLKAKEWSEDFARGRGRPPTEAEYRHDQPRRYYDVDGGYAHAGGFGGYPPERIEAIRRSYMFGGRGGGRRVPPASGYGSSPRPFSLGRQTRNVPIGGGRGGY